MKLKSFGLAVVTVLSIGVGPPALATLFSSSDVPVAICDLCDVSSTLNVNSHIVITDVNGLLTSLLHTFDNDLRISLIAPDATTIVLSNRHGGSGDNFTNTVFDDEAGVAIAAGIAPFTGSFRPDGLLSTLDGLDAFGTWTLRVQDQVGQDSGSIQNWGLDISGRTQAIPEPGSLALLGLSLAGLALARRRMAS